MAKVQKIEEDKLANAKRQGQAQFDSIKEMVGKVQRLEALTIQHGTAWHGKPVREDGVSLEEARRVIEEDALSVQVRSGWHNPGDSEGAKPEEYEILLCTGGPACRIIGTLDEHGNPDTARLEVADWFQSWTEYRPKVSEDDFNSEPVLLEYARCFYFGE